MCACAHTLIAFTARVLVSASLARRSPRHAPPPPPPSPHACLPPVHEKFAQAGVAGGFGVMSGNFGERVVGRGRA
ncbi:hypothetical protein DENSPDRAFT_74958 [Dentipellis sp. KUC8613]|nr:hypothetical protein DENSPDRAFT_74958 [Dentipellis sp. KUC8613]